MSDYRDNNYIIFLFEGRLYIIFTLLMIHILPFVYDKYTQIFFPVKFLNV